MGDSNVEQPGENLTPGITFQGHIRKIATDARDLSLNLTITIFDGQNLDGLLNLRDKSVQVGLVVLPE